MYTIRTDYRDETVIEKSRFICTLKKVSSETEAQDFIKAVKKKSFGMLRIIVLLILLMSWRKDRVMTANRQERQDCQCLKCCGKIS